MKIATLILCVGALVEDLAAALCFVINSAFYNSKSESLNRKTGLLKIGNQDSSIEN